MCPKYKMTSFINCHLTIQSLHRGLNKCYFETADFFPPHHTIATRASWWAIIAESRDNTWYKIIWIPQNHSTSAECSNLEPSKTFDICYLVCVYIQDKNKWTSSKWILINIST